MGTMSNVRGLIKKFQPFGTCYLWRLRKEWYDSPYSLLTFLFRNLKSHFIKRRFDTIDAKKKSLEAPSAVGSNLIHEGTSFSYL